MHALLTPARRRGVEFLDDPSTPDADRQLAMADLMRSNTLFGGTRAARRALRNVLAVERHVTLLDVGTGHADIPRHLREEARQCDTSLTLIGLDVSVSLLHSARTVVDAVVCADAARLPLDDDSVDVAACSQLLHHFDETGARALIAELHRVSRGWVLISDLRRSWLAAGGYWLGATALRFHEITRHDGVVSVMRGFTADELRHLIVDSTGAVPTMRREAFWRVTALWRTREPVATAA
jgi:SAM-dependent methyltransferase